MARALLSILVATGLMGCMNSPNSFFSDGGDGAGGDPGTSVSGDLPCDVADVLSQNCVSCHSGSTPSGGVALTSRDELTAPSPTVASQTVAQRALARMQDPQNPMPPSGVPAAADVAAFAAWVNAGTPVGDCGSTPTPEITCTSGQTWHGEEGKGMNPGEACISCHAKGGGEEDEKGPLFGFAGTVYPTLHEPDGCIPAAADVSGAVVIVTDANGQEYQAPVLSGGNFYVEEVFPTFPVYARVERNGATSSMKDPVDSGDCNTCHTATGTDGAPGRIAAP
ncbi:MAG: c-type cytochrome domain-containing protein [Polyangiaceae bacterium]